MFSDNEPPDLVSCSDDSDSSEDEAPPPLTPIRSANMRTAPESRASLSSSHANENPGSGGGGGGGGGGGYDSYDDSNALAQTRSDYLARMGLTRTSHFDLNDLLGGLSLWRTPRPTPRCPLCRGPGRIGCRVTNRCATCPVCLEDFDGTEGCPPLVQYPCGHVLCEQDFRKLGGQLEGEEVVVVEERMADHRSASNLPPNLPRHTGFDAEFYGWPMNFDTAEFLHVRERRWRHQQSTIQVPRWTDNSEPNSTANTSSELREINRLVRAIDNIEIQHRALMEDIIEIPHAAPEPPPLQLQRRRERQRREKQQRQHQRQERRRELKQQNHKTRQVPTHRHQGKNRR